MKTQSVKIADVKCSIMNGKLTLELPQGMDGVKYKKWRDRYISEAKEKLGIIK